MRGLLDLDVLCLAEIFKLLTPLDLCSLRQCSTQLRDIIDFHCRSLYFARGQYLDLREENIRNVDKILKNLGQFVRSLRIREIKTEPNSLLDVITTNCQNVLRRLYLDEMGEFVRSLIMPEMKTELNLLLDAIATNCRDVLRRLSFSSLRFYDIKMEKFAGVCDNLEFLELWDCSGDRKCIEQFLLGHDYPNLKTLRIWSEDGTVSGIWTEILKTFFMRKRNIQILSFSYTVNDLLPLIALNAAKIMELDIRLDHATSWMPLTQLRELKRLQIHCSVCTPIGCEQSSIIALIKGLSVNTKLEALALYQFNLSDELCDALSNLTNLKTLILLAGQFTAHGTTSMEMLGQKLSKLESLTLALLAHFPYRSLLASALGDFFLFGIDNFIKQLAKDVIDGGGLRCFVSGNPLCIYIKNVSSQRFQHMSFQHLQVLVTKDNLKSIENGKIKIIWDPTEIFDI